MADEAHESEVKNVSSSPEKKIIPAIETNIETGNEQTEKEEEKSEKLQKLETELKESGQRVVPSEKNVTTSVSESGATYGKNYADIAESRFGKGALAKHGEAAIAKAVKSGFPDNAIVLEVGCNTGMLLEQLKSNLGGKASKISGIDFNRDAVEIAKQKGLDADFGDAQNLGKIQDSSVDMVFSLHTYEHVPDLGKAFKELQRILKPGGKAYIIVPPNMYGLETIRVAAEDLPEDKKGKGPFGGIKTFLNAWAYARKLHCSNLGGPFGGARSHAEKIIKSAGMTDLKVSGGMRPDLALANFLIFEKSTSPIS